MARGIGDIQQFFKTLEFYRQGWKQALILEELESIYKSDSVSLRTVGSYLKMFRDKDAELKDDDPIYWHQLEEYGFGWESSEGVDLFYKARGYMPSKRWLKWWNRLSRLRWESNEDLLKWIDSYVQHELKQLFRIRSGSLGQLEKDMFKERRGNVT